MPELRIPKLPPKSLTVARATHLKRLSLLIIQRGKTLPSFFRAFRIFLLHPKSETRPLDICLLGEDKTEERKALKTKKTDSKMATQEDLGALEREQRDNEENDRGKDKDMDKDGKDDDNKDKEGDKDKKSSSGGDGGDGGGGGGGGGGGDGQDGDAEMKDAADDNNNAEEGGAAAGKDEEEQREPDLLDDEILRSSTQDINMRRRLLENDLRIIKSEHQRLTHEKAAMNEKIKDNLDKIENNR
jgi:hypothetical protein